VRDSIRRIGEFFLNNWGMKILALLLAALSFFGIRGKTGVEIPYDIPLEVKFGEKGIAILELETRTARVTFQGSQEDLRRIEQRDLKAVIRPEAQSIAGAEQVQIKPGNIVGVPAGVRVGRIEPESVSLIFDREAEIEVAVAEPRTIGVPLIGRAQLEYEPRTVTLRGPKRRIEDQHILATEPVDVSGRMVSFSKQVRVLPPSDTWVPDIEPAEITVRVNIVTESITREWTNVMIMAVAPPGHRPAVSFDPPHVAVSLHGRSEILESLTGDAVTVFVDYHELDPSRSYELPVQVHLPAGIDVRAKVEPDTVTIVFQNP